MSSATGVTKTESAARLGYGGGTITHTKDSEGAEMTAMSKRMLATTMEASSQRPRGGATLSASSNRAHSVTRGGRV